MDPKDFEKLTRFFTGISEDPDETELSRVYLT